MKIESAKALENLSLYSHIGGVVTIFLGLVVTFINLLNKDFRHIQVGLFIFSTGYAFVKISSKIVHILQTEDAD